MLVKSTFVFSKKKKSINSDVQLYMILNQNKLVNHFDITKMAYRTLMTTLLLRSYYTVDKTGDRSISCEIFVKAVEIYLIWNIGKIKFVFIKFRCY